MAVKATKKPMRKTKAVKKYKTPQQRKFAMAAKEASRRVKKDPRLNFQVEMRKLLH
jgi:hypothetical protein